MAMEEGGMGLELGPCKETEARKWTDCMWQVVHYFSFWKGQQSVGTKEELVCQSLTQTRCPSLLLSFHLLVPSSHRRALAEGTGLRSGEVLCLWRALGFVGDPVCKRQGGKCCSRSLDDTDRVFNRCVDVKDEMLTSVGRRQARRGFLPGLSGDCGEGSPSLSPVRSEGS